MVGCRGRAETNEGDIRQVCPLRFLIDGTEVKSRIFGRRAIDGKHVHDGQKGEEHFWRRLNQPTVFTVPTSAI